MDTRLIVYGIWAVAMLIVWGAVVRDDWRAFKRDRRNVLTDLATDAALLGSALAAAVSLVVLIVGAEIPGVRGFALALFLGCFLAAGIIKWTLPRAERWRVRR